MSVDFAARVVTIARGEHLSVQALGNGDFRVRAEYAGDWVHLDLSREQAEQFNTNLHAALLESLTY